MPRSAKQAEVEREFHPLREGASALGGLIVRNPVPVGGVTALLVAFSYVSANAVWYQPHFHTGAFFATRDVVNLEALPSEEPSETTIKIVRPLILPPSDPVVERVQSILRDLDFYTGDIDGLMGPNTKKAIAIYRGKVGLGPSDEIDDDLLDHLGARQTTSAIAPEPEAAQREAAPGREPVTLASVPEGAPTPPARPKTAEAGDPKVMKIQAGLRAFGHKSMEIDGLLGSKTRSAIKEFESIFGLPVTGEPNAALMAKMREAGYIN